MEKVGLKENSRDEDLTGNRSDRVCCSFILTGVLPFMTHIPTLKFLDNVYIRRNSVKKEGENMFYYPRM